MIVGRSQRESQIAFWPTKFDESWEVGQCTWQIKRLSLFYNVFPPLLFSLTRDEFARRQSHQRAPSLPHPQPISGGRAFSLDKSDRYITPPAARHWHHGGRGQTKATSWCILGKRRPLFFFPFLRRRKRRRRALVKSKCRTAGKQGSRDSCGTRRRFK